MKRTPHVFAMLVAATLPAYSQGYPPAQGPPTPSGQLLAYPAQYLVTEPLKAKLDSKIYELNAELLAKSEQEGVRAKLSATVKGFGTISAETKYPDRPNNRYVNMPHILTITVSNIQEKKAGLWVPYPWSRKITVSTDVGVFCNGWQTGAGEIGVESHSDRPYLDPNPSFSEGIVDFFLGGVLSNMVNTKVRAALSDVRIQSTSSGTPFVCNTLGATKGDVANPEDDLIVWTDKPVLATSIATRVTVRPLKIKRLAARDYTNRVLYDPAEAPVLEFWAGYEARGLDLPAMVEGQEVSLAGLTPVQVTPPSGTSLVVIASLTHLNRGIEDSNFRVFSRSANFGAGTQTVVLNKTYWKPATVGTKPIKMTVPAYEITFQVDMQGLVAVPGITTR